MKQNPIGTFLVAVLLLGSLVTAWLSFSYVRYILELRGLQATATVINRNRTMFQNLAGDAVAYSRVNPAILPLLEEVGIQITPGKSPEMPDADQN